MLNGKVLVTRAAFAMRETVACVNAAGFDVFEEPLIEIKPTHAICPSLHAAPVLMITSRAAFQIWSKKDAACFLACPCFCVGERTAAHARAFGFTFVETGPGDGLALADQIIRAVPSSTPILHPGAVLSDKKAAFKLAAHGFDVVSWPVYEAVPAAELSFSLRQALERGEISAALFFSSRTGQTFLAGVARAALSQACRAIKAVAISRQVAHILEPLPWRKLVVACAPSLNDVVACLQATEKGV